MAVLVEGISVIARRERLDELFPGGHSQYIADCPNATACADTHLVRIGFMDPDAVRAHIRRMESLGFIHLDEHGAAGDIVVIDQLNGPTSRCDWAEYGHVTIKGNSIAVARLIGDESLQLITPSDWNYDKSLTTSHRRVVQSDAVREPFARDQEDAAALAALAEEHREKGDLAAAEAAYDRAVTVAPARHLHVLLNGLGNVFIESGRHSEAAECLERSLQAFARNTIARLAQGNHRTAHLASDPDINAEVWHEWAIYAAMHSTAADSEIEAFAIPTPESARAEATSREHGGLYWEDKTDADGRRTRHFFPNYFNAFWRECLLDPLYPVILWTRGTTLKAIDSPDAERHFTEAEIIRSLLHTVVE
jgi:tetratricopeptide (TPR) repeat protein